MLFLEFHVLYLHSWRQAEPDSRMALRVECIQPSLRPQIILSSCDCVLKRLATRIMDFCHWIKAHPEMLSVILFSDEASFTQDGVNNSRNVHTLSHDNPHETSITNFQRRFSLNVWCGVIGNRLIGPFVFENNLAAHTYEAFVRNELPRFVGRNRVNDKEPNVLPT